MPGDLKWPWALPGVLAALVVLGLWWSRRPRPPGGEALLVADTARLRTLPRFRTLLRRRRVLGLLATGAALTAVVGAALVVARPQHRETEPREARGRDIMLCLDASASMDGYDAQVIDEVRRIVAGLHGDRIGMMIWSGAAVLVFPLTDDYHYVDAQLDRAQAAFTSNDDNFYAGVDLLSNRASQIGDGIVSCIHHFSPPIGQRTRAVVVASDNDPVGTPAYTLPDAGRYAADHHVLLYGIGAPTLAQPDRAGARQQFADAVSSTGGTLALLGQDGSANRIVDRIDDLEKARAVEPPRPVSYDAPQAGVAVTVAGVVLLALMWAGQLIGRVRRRGRR